MGEDYEKHIRTSSLIIPFSTFWMKKKSITWTIYIQEKQNSNFNIIEFEDQLANFRSSRKKLRKEEAKEHSKQKHDVYQTHVIETKQPMVKLCMTQENLNLILNSSLYMSCINKNIKISLTCALFFGFFPLKYTKIYPNNTNKWNEFG